MTDYLSDEQLDSLYGDAFMVPGTTPLGDRAKLVRVDMLQALIDEVREARKFASVVSNGSMDIKALLDEAESKPVPSKLCVTPVPHNGYECRTADGRSPYGETLDPNGAIVDDPSAGIRTAAPKPKPTWKVTFTHVGSSALKRDLAEGWEPFAADGGDVYLRRQR